MKKVSLLSIGKIAIGAVLAYGFLNFIDQPDVMIESFKNGFLEGILGK